MKKLIVIASLAVATLSFSNQAAAQTKFGYINSGELMSMMPEYKTANTSLEGIMKKAQEDLEKMKKDLQVKYEAYQRDEKTMSDAIKEVKQSEIRNADENMQMFTQKAEESIGAKKDALLAPIMKKANDAIVEVAKANNIGYVFDVANSGIIYAPPGDDMMPLMKTKLNLKETPMTVPANKPAVPKKN